LVVLAQPEQPNPSFAESVEDAGVTGPQAGDRLGLAPDLLLVLAVRQRVPAQFFDLCLPLAGHLVPECKQAVEGRPLGDELPGGGGHGCIASARCPEQFFPPAPGGRFEASIVLLAGRQDSANPGPAGLGPQGTDWCERNYDNGEPGQGT